MSIRLVTILTILFFSGCAATTPVRDSGSPVDTSQERQADDVVRQENADEVLASVNGEEITIGDYNNKLKRLSIYEKARYRGEEGHREFLRALILQKAMVQKAKEMGLDGDEEVQREIESLVKEVTESALIEALIKREILDKVVVTNREAKAYYDEHREEFAKKEKVSIRQIIVATEEEAQKILQELDAGADFAKLSEERSISQNKGAQTGTLIELERGRMAGEFEEVCFGLKVGETSDVLKTGLGYHIIKLEGKEEASVKEFYEVSDEIKKKLISGKQQKEHQKWLQQLEEKAKIEIKSGFGES